MILGYISILYKHSTVFWCSTLLVLWGDPLYSELICGSQISHYYSIADTKTRLYSFNRHWFFMYIMLVEFPSKIVQWLRAYGALLIKTLLNQAISWNQFKTLENLWFFNHCVVAYHYKFIILSEKPANSGNFYYWLVHT